MVSIDSIEQMVIGFGEGCLRDSCVARRFAVPIMAKGLGKIARSGARRVLQLIAEFEISFRGRRLDDLVHADFELVRKLPTLKVFEPRNASHAVRPSNMCS